jgi:hypothetical protein
VSNVFWNFILSPLIRLTSRDLIIQPTENYPFTQIAIYSNIIKNIYGIEYPSPHESIR